MRKGSHNLLLVYHSWFETSLNTLEVLGKRIAELGQHHSPGASPLEPVLGGRRCESDIHFTDAVRGRVMQGTLQRVHLVSVR